MSRNAAGIVNLDELATEFTSEVAFINGTSVPSSEPSPLWRTLQLMISLSDRPNGLPGTVEELRLWRELNGRVASLVRPFNHRYGMNMPIVKI